MVRQAKFHLSVSWDRPYTDSSGCSSTCSVWKQESILQANTSGTKEAWAKLHVHFSWGPEQRLWK